MLRRVEATSEKDVLLPIGQRREAGVYFLRVCQAWDGFQDWVWQVHEAARQQGVIVEGQIPNPDDRQLSYLKDVLGDAFAPDRAFILSALEKWVPRMTAAHRGEFADALCQQLDELKSRGKSDSILKNVYIKMMCWLYYKFERMMPFLGQDAPPKVLYEGSGITSHELIFLRMLNRIGADVVLLAAGGDEAYLKQDPASQWSQLLQVPGGRPFPADFSLKALRKEYAAKAASRPAPAARPIQQPPRPAQPVARPTQPPRPSPGPAPAARTSVDPESRFPAPATSPCTNAWMQEAAFTQILTPPVTRGEDHKLFYNSLVRVTGVQDKLTYVNELYQFYQTLNVNHRKVLVLDGKIPQAEPEELQKIRRRNYRFPEELIIDLAGNLPSSAHVELQRLSQRAFARVMKEEAKAEPNLNRLTVTAVYILCWVQRYQAQLFGGWREGEVPVLIKMGGCQSRAEAAYLRYLSQLPVDVLILCPNLNQPCQLQSDALLEITGPESLAIEAFPMQSGGLQMRTVASHAEHDLTSILYADSGIYRNRQFQRAESITLRTTYDEIFILWDQELKYRPNFSAAEQVANLPVIFAKVSGVEEGKTLPYWQKIKELVDAPNTLLFRQFPLISPSAGNPYQSLAVKCVHNERLRREEIKNSRQYPFGLLREDMQEHILDKVQQMLDQRTVKGTFVNGTEYTVLSTVLNLSKELLRLIQGFDFTKKNPKLVVINTKDQQATLEDAILLSFLNKLGFDIALFVPTGYQTIERFLVDHTLVEHQVGDYVYDLPVPDFSAIQSNKGPAWLNHILRRGR